MGEKLTLIQLARLVEISRERLPQFGEAAWWGNATDKSLLRRGLIERCDHVKKFGGDVSFSTYLCRITPAGRAALASTHKEP